MALVVSFVTFLIPSGWQAVFTAIGAFFGWFGKTTIIPNWLLVIFIASTMSLVFWTVLILWAKTRKSEELPKPPFEMTILGIHWRWKSGSDGGIYSLTPFCPKCDLQIHPPTNPAFIAVSGAVYVCDNCDWQSERLGSSTNEVEDRATRIIQQKLRQATRERSDDV